MINALDEVELELAAARRHYPPMRSAHEGWAILREEVDELWEEVKRKDSVRDKAVMRAEAVQVAAMALRFIEDICNEEGEERVFPVAELAVWPMEPGR